MSHMNEIIVLDDDEEEETPRPTKASPRNPPKQTNGKAEESSSSQQSKAAAVSAQNKALFNEFIEFCSKLTTEHPEVISFLQGRYAKASPSYLSSVEFRNTVGRCLTRVQTKKSKIFVYINELCTALKANSQKRKVSLKTQAQPIQQPTEVKTEAPKEDEEEAHHTPVKKSGSKRQIRYLENLLRIYSLEIKKLQERELSLDELDDEDSSYIQESRLKRKLLRIFEKLCDLKDCNSLTGRVIEQRILYRGTRYPEINRRLEKFINSSRDLFPDYGDVIRVVERANDKHHLGLSRKQMQNMAQDAFRELGNKLQDRRHLDMVYNFGCHLTDVYKSVNDPAQQDSSLSRRLRDNRNTAMSRLDDIIRKYADLQDDGDDEHRMKTRRGPERVKQSSSEASEEEEESEDSETDIEEELEQSKEVLESEEEENEEEETPADQENDADQKMDMASGAEEDRDKDKEDGDDENVTEEQEEATEQESSPASTSASSSHDKDSPNTTLESEVEAQLPASPDPPPSSTDSPDKAEDEHNEEPEVSETTTNTGDQTEEKQEDCDSGPSSVDKGSNENEESADGIPDCDSPCDVPGDTAKHKDPQKYLLPDMTVSLEEDEENRGEDGGDVTEAAGDPSCDGVNSEPSPVAQEESDANVVLLTEVSSVFMSEDSKAANKEEPACADMAGNDEGDDDDGSGDDDDGSGDDDDGGEDDNDNGDGGDNDDNDDNDDGGGGGGDDDDGGEDEDPEEDLPASGHQSPSDSPTVGHEATATSVHTETDNLEKETDCDMSPVGSSNGVHADTQVQGTPINRLKLNKDKVTLRDSSTPKNTAEDIPPPNRKRKGMFPQKWTKNNGLARYNGKEHTEEHKERNCKRAKMDCSYSSLSSSSDSDSDSLEEDDQTPGLMMTCSPRETPKKSIIKSNVSTQCDPDEVIVLSD